MLLTTIEDERERVTRDIYKVKCRQQDRGKYITQSVLHTIGNAWFETIGTIQ